MSDLKKGGPKMRSLTIAFCTLAIAPDAMAAQAIDCTTPIGKAQKSVDKITGDLQGMDKMMPKDELGQIHGLVADAEKLLNEARQDCSKSASPYDQARGIAHADAADGYATAADILHFHYMQTMSGGASKPMAGGAAKPKGSMQDMK
jgi:hypothetical protein